MPEIPAIPPAGPKPAASAVSAAGQARPNTPAHSLLEDAIGIITGVFVASLGLFILSSAHTVTGGTAGLALLITYATQLPFGVVLFAINVPFFALALWKKGWSFTLRTAASVALVSVFSLLHPLAFGDLALDPVYGTFAGNLLTGIGLLVLFRHGSSLGGFNILALLAQERLGWRAGYVQLVLDASVIVAALAVVSPLNVALSAAGAVVLNLVLAMNHRPGRYLSA